MQNLANLSNIASLGKSKGRNQLDALLSKHVNDKGGVYAATNESTGSVTKIINPALATGRDIIIGGGFADNPGDWTLGANWTIGGGNATHAASATADLSQNNIVEAGRDYELTFTISNRTAGSIVPKLTASGTTRSTNATFTETITSTGTDLDFTPSSDFDGNIDNVSVKQTSIAASTAFPGSELYVDGDMEAAGVGDWTVINSAILTKETADPYAGSRNLKVLFGGIVSPIADQSILTVGKRYKVTGRARSDGVVLPEVRGNNSTDDNLFVGTTSTDWQEINLEFVSSSTSIWLLSRATGAGEYAEFDDVSVTEVNPLNGDITGATVNVSAGAKLKKAYTFDGANDFVDIFSAELNSIFDPTKGTLLAFAKVSGSGVWTDGTERRPIELLVDGSNFFIYRKNTDNNSFSLISLMGGTNKTITKTSFSPTDFFMIAMTWDTSADELKVYFNGVQTGSTLSGLGTWVGNLVSTNTVIGAASTVPDQVWDGDLSHVMLLTEVLSSAEIARISRLGGTS